MRDGRKVDSAEMWTGERRPEILELFRVNVYGRAPVGRPLDLTFEVTERDADALGGLAVRENVTISFSGPGGRAAIRILVFRPRAATGPAPCFLHIMHRMRPPVDPASVSSPYWPVERIVARGYATVAYAPGEIDADADDGFRGGVHGIFDPPSGRARDAWGTISAWAWGASRVLDYLSTDPAIDSTRVAVIGHSRSGKAALWAGAQDERFALVVSNNSGSTGAAMARGKTGERVADINRQFPHWFCENYHAFGGREEELPVDQHLLLALVAPRPLSVASGSQDGWADPASEFRSCVLASPVFELLGFRGVGALDYPQPDTTLHTGRIGYHVRPGRHGLLEYDWERHLDFADRKWGRKPR
jgi:hypothetical protein